MPRLQLALWFLLAALFLSGGIEPPNAYAASSSNRGLHVFFHDVDRDGDIDLLTIGAKKSQATLYLNDGRGGFQQAAPKSLLTRDDAPALVGHIHLATVPICLMPSLEGVATPFGLAIHSPVSAIIRIRDALPNTPVWLGPHCLASSLSRRGPPAVPFS